MSISVREQVGHEDELHSSAPYVQGPKDMIHDLTSSYGRTGE